MTDRFYVYAHTRKDTGSVFYIGKGTYGRTKSFGRAASSWTRSRFWKAIVIRAGGFDCEILSVCATEPLAFRLERAFIAAHGRRLDGGTLCNLTLGGEGMAGHVPTPETKAKRRNSLLGRVVSGETRARISESLSGERHPLFGKKRSAETRRRQSLSGKGLHLGGKSPMAKPVRDTITGRIFPSTRDAAEHFGIRMRYLSAQLAGERTNKTTLERI